MSRLPSMYEVVRVQTLYRSFHDPLFEYLTEQPPRALCRNCGHLFWEHWKTLSETWSPDLPICCFSCPGYDESDSSPHFAPGYDPEPPGALCANCSHAFEDHVLWAMDGCGGPVIRLAWYECDCPGYDEGGR